MIDHHLDTLTTLTTLTMTWVIEEELAGLESAIHQIGPRSVAAIVQSELAAHPGLEHPTTTPDATTLTEAA